MNGDIQAHADCHFINGNGIPVVNGSLGGIQEITVLVLVLTEAG